MDLNTRAIAIVFLHSEHLRIEAQRAVWIADREIDVRQSMSFDRRVRSSASDEESRHAPANPAGDFVRQGAGDLREFFRRDRKTTGLTKQYDLVV